MAAQVIRRYAQRQLNTRTDLVALAQAKAEIRALVERDFNRKSAQGRKRHARFLEDYAGKSSPTITIQQMSDGNSNHCEVALTPITEDASAEANSTPPSAPVRSDLFLDDEILPVFEANLDLPSAPVELVEPAEMHNA